MPGREDGPGEDPSDGTGELSEKTGERGRSTQCAVCDSPVNPDEWHPVTTEVDDSGEFNLLVFCSVECRNEWQAD